MTECFLSSNLLTFHCADSESLIILLEYILDHKGKWQNCSAIRGAQKRNLSKENTVASSWRRSFIEDPLKKIYIKIYIYIKVQHTQKG